jgi:uncharacterized protein YndB with AHSA1/START domain
MADEYVFIDEWDVDAPQEAVFDALADARTYPRWWRPVYIAVEADRPPEVGCVSRQEFKGRLPYHLKTRSEIVRIEPPREFEVQVVGDLTGKPAAAPHPHPRAAPALPLEPQLVDQAGDRGPGALRPLPRRTLALDPEIRGGLSVEASPRARTRQELAPAGVVLVLGRAADLARLGARLGGGAARRGDPEHPHRL